MHEIYELGAKAKKAARAVAIATAEQKNAALEAISKALLDNTEYILSENKKDELAASANGMSEAMLDRLRLDKQRLEAIASAVLKLKNLSDPIGDILESFTLPNGLEISKVRVPMGVIGIIYESRPNVTVDAAVLCLKAGSAAFLRGGSETINSNIALESVMRKAVQSAGLPSDCITLLHDTSRQTANEMMAMRGIIDVLIPRGGAGLIRAVVENAKVPVIETGTGNCHIYVDKTAAFDMALDIAYNAKTQRVSVCNAAESLLVHKDIAAAFLPLLQKKLAQKNVELRLCPLSKSILGGGIDATADDWGREFLDYILSVKVVDDVNAAIEHISLYSSGHSECIVSNDQSAISAFTAAVDSAAVYVNASTRFTDGEQFGFGAEIGISTQKLHARGPMALPEICSYKYIIKGKGQTRP